MRENPEPPFSPKPIITFAHVSLSMSTPLLEGILCRISRKLTLKSIAKSFLKNLNFKINVVFTTICTHSLPEEIGKNLQRNSRGEKKAQIDVSVDSKNIE